MSGCVPAVARMTDAIDAAIDTALHEQRLVGTVVAVAAGGSTIYKRAAGMFDRENGVPMREDAIFRLASVSKLFVAVAALRLAANNAIRLDYPVSRWLPAFRPSQPDGTHPDITLHQLLTHTSGLSYRFLEKVESAYHRMDVSDGLDLPGRTMDDNLQRLGTAPLLFNPGTRWRYSLGIDVLGAVLEAATGAPLDRIIRDEVTGPLGLIDTGFYLSDLSRLAIPYADGLNGPLRMNGTVAVKLPLNAGDGVIPFAPDRILDPASFLSGGAGMVGTASDILSILEALRTNDARITQSELFALLSTDHVGAQAETQGPGWGFSYGGAVLVDPLPTNTPQGEGTLQWGGAYGHCWFVDPKNKLSVVMLSNTAFEGMAGRFVVDVRDAVYK